MPNPTLSRILADIRDLCGKPSREQLGDDHVLSAIFDVQTSLNNDLNLSSQNRLVERVEFPLVSQEMGVPVSDMDNPERVEILSSGFDRWSPLTISGLDELRGQVSVGTPDTLASRVAFVGSRMYFDGLPPNATVRLWYKPVYSESEDLGDTVKGVPQSFIGLLKLRAAAFLRETFLALPVPESWQGEVMRLERQFKQMRTRGSESGLVKKSRYGSGRGIGNSFGWSGHRFR
jgi:hypothetical protein